MSQISVVDSSAVANVVHPRTGRLRIFVLGATGTIGQATVRELVRRNHEVVCFVRPRVAEGWVAGSEAKATHLAGATLRYGEVTEPRSLARDGFRDEPFDAVVSCLASRTGASADAWSIDYQAQLHALEAAATAGVKHMVLLSALCVQKPRLDFQFAKLAFEEKLRNSGVDYSIIRPTAYFKSLCGQVERVKRGKPFLVFGDGTLTSCKPISDEDLASYLADCLIDPQRRNRILPIGGPGDAITPRQQAERLFSLLGRPPAIRSVPVSFLSGVAGALDCVGRVVPRAARKAEFARIGRYYATESMLVWDPQAGRYDADRTPSTGTVSLFDFYARLIHGTASVDLGDHAAF